MKTNAKALIVLTVVIAIGGGGCMFGEKVDIEREFDLDSVNGIAVTVESVNLKIIPAESPETIRFHYYGKTLAKTDFFAGLSGGFATFTDTSKAQRMGDLHLDLYVPAGFEKAISITTTSGCVEFDALECGSFSFSATSGNLKATSIRAGELVARTTSGNTDVGSITASRYAFGSKSGNLTADSVRADEVVFSATMGNRTVRRLDAGKLEATATSGSIKAEEYSARETWVKTTSGAVSLSFGNFAGDRLTAETTAGRITIALPRTAGFDFTAKTSGGRIDSDFPGMADTVSGSKNVELRIGSGEGSISLETKSGGIRLTSR